RTGDVASSVTCPPRIGTDTCGPAPLRTRAWAAVRCDPASVARNPSETGSISGRPGSAQQRPVVLEIVDQRLVVRVVRRDRLVVPAQHTLPGPRGDARRSQGQREGAPRPVNLHDQ